MMSMSVPVSVFTFVCVCLSISGRSLLCNELLWSQWLALALSTLLFTLFTLWLLLQELLFFIPLLLSRRTLYLQGILLVRKRK